MGGTSIGSPQDEIVPPASTAPHFDLASNNRTISVWLTAPRGTLNVPNADNLKVGASAFGAAFVHDGTPQRSHQFADRVAIR